MTAKTDLRVSRLCKRFGDGTLATDNLDLDLDGFVSETISLDDVEEAFHKMERGEVLRSVVVM